MADYFQKDGDNFVKVDDHLLPQTEVDSIVEKRLERERAKYADYDTIKETASSVETIKQEFETKLKEKDGKLSEFEKQLQAKALEVDKVNIVHEFALPKDLHEFVIGDNAEQMRERAEKLSKSVKPAGVPIDKKQKPQETESDSKKLAKNLFGSKSD